MKKQIILAEGKVTKFKDMICYDYYIGGKDVTQLGNTTVLRDFVDKEVKLILEVSK